MYSICTKCERKENENYTKDKKKRSNNIACTSYNNSYNVIISSNINTNGIR